VETLQPLYADWKGRPQCVCCFSANVQIPLFGLPQGKSLGPHVKDQELNPRPHAPRPAALPVKVEQWVVKVEQWVRVQGSVISTRTTWPGQQASKFERADCKRLSGLHTTHEMQLG